MNAAPTRLIQRRPIIGGLALVAAAATGLLLLLGGHAAATGNQGPARLILVRTSPITVTGKGFRDHTRMHVTVRAQGSFVRRPVTNGSGAFTVSFPTSVDRCGGWSITARPSRGETVVLRARLAMCAPA